VSSLDDRLERQRKEREAAGGPRRRQIDVSGPGQEPGSVTVDGGEEAPLRPEPPEPSAQEWALLPEAMVAVPIHIGLARVAAELRAVGKDDAFRSTNAGNYNYRGIDRVVNAVAPLLNRHGILMLPDVISVEYRDVARTGGRSHECLVRMLYTFVGPKGDRLPVSVLGESLDTSDKSSAKAQSVAWRTAMIQTFHIATQDEDPDATRIERTDAPAPKAADYVDEIANPSTGVRRLQQIRNEINTHNLGLTIVTNETGDDEALGAMLRRIGQERQASGQD
jgi:ERF superfamily